MKSIKNRIKQIGKRIEKERENFSMSNVELAKRCRLSPEYIAEVECGVRVPSFSALQRISRALQIPPEEILTGKRAHPIYYADKKTLVKLEKVINLLTSINMGDWKLLKAPRG